MNPLVRAQLGTLRVSDLIEGQRRRSGVHRRATTVFRRSPERGEGL